MLLALIGTWHDETSTGAITVGVGAAALIIGSFLVMPALAKPIAGGIGRVIGAPFGAVGRLAATNAGRNTRRTAATAFALTLGLTLVAAFGTLGATTKASIDGIIDDGLDADVVVQGVPTGGGMPLPLSAGLPDRTAGGAGVEDVVSYSFGYGMLGGESQPVAAGRGPVEELVSATVTDGSIQPGPDSLIVSSDVARSNGWTKGAQVPLVGPDGAENDLTVTGAYSDAEILGPFYIGNDTYEQMIPENLRNTQMVLATAADGTSTEQLVESMTDELADIPIASVQTKQQFIDVQAGGIDQLLTVIY